MTTCTRKVGAHVNFREPVHYSIEKNPKNYMGLPGRVSFSHWSGGIQEEKLTKVSIAK